MDNECRKYEYVVKFRVKDSKVNGHSWNNNNVVDCKTKMAQYQQDPCIENHCI